MQYCEIKDNGIIIMLPESVRRLERVILASALDCGAFGEVKGTIVDEKKGNYRRIDVTFPNIQAFAEKTDNAIKALVEKNDKSS